MWVLYEIFFLLNGILTSVSFDVVKKFYVRPSDSKSLSLAHLLNQFPSSARAVIHQVYH